MVLPEETAARGTCSFLFLKCRLLTFLSRYLILFGQTHFTDSRFLASVEYAVGSLGAYRVIVMGHDGRRILSASTPVLIVDAGCGGVQEGHYLAQTEIARHAGYEVKDPVYPLAVADWLTTIKDMVLLGILFPLYN